MRINISMNDTDIERIEKLKTVSGISQTSSLIRHALICLEKETSTRSVEDEWSEYMPNVPDPGRNALKEKAKKNMESSVEMVDTPLGRMSSSAAKSMNMTNEELLAGVNNVKPDEERVIQEKIAILKRRFPESSIEHLKYLSTLEQDSNGELIYE